MEKSYTERARECVAETREALQTFYNALNQGQQKKIMKNATVAEIVKRYGVETGGN